MSTRVRLHHVTQYSYDRPVVLGPHILRLRPKADGRTPIFDYSLSVSHADCYLHWQTDSINNHEARLVVPEKLNGLQIDVRFEAVLKSVNSFDFLVDNDVAEYPFEYAERANLLPYLRLAERGARFFEFVHAAETKSNTVDFLVSLNQAVEREIQYTIREEVGIQRCEETLQLRQGSCRDMAWLLIQVLRQLGFAARFVSGYLIQLKTQDVGEPNRIDHDLADYHAWAEVYLPGAGWIGLDPTSGMLATGGHIAVAAGPTPEHTAAVSGTHSEAKQTLKHDLSIARQPRTVQPPTHPYAKSNWADVGSSANAFG